MTIAACAVACCLLFASSAFAAEEHPDLIVKYKKNTDFLQIQTKNAEYGLTIKKTIKDNHVQAVAIKDGESAANKIFELKQDPAVEYAEPNGTMRALATTPNDTFYSGYQWNMQITHADDAWDTWRGSNTVTIAVVDTGVSLTHEDLSTKIVPGYDFVDDDAVPMDEAGHGTHVAGIAAASANNNLGVAGMDWNARIMPVRVLNAEGSGGFLEVANGIYWAADHGADVVNLSLGDSHYSQTVQDAIDYAYGLGVVVVAAAGNYAQEGNPVFYPASGPHVISVAATTSSDTWASFSEYNEFVDVAAPGVLIASTYWSIANPNHSYAQSGGTSMASPHVAGLAALVMSRNPALTNDQVEAIIENTATDLGAPYRDNYFGYGRIDVAAAVLAATAGPLDHIQVNGSTTVTEGQSARFTALGNDAAHLPIPYLTYDWEATGGTVNPTTGSASTMYLAGYDLGTYSITARTGGLSGTTPITVTPKLVHRFYNYRQGVHFYTIDDAEYQSLLIAGYWTFRYEGIGFPARDINASGSTIPVHRFYNIVKGVHFYTANQSEATYVNDNLWQLYRYEGVAYRAYQTPAAAEPLLSKPVHRFYNFLDGAHFYTADQAEATRINDTAWWTYRYEGVAYYVPQ